MDVLENYKLDRAFSEGVEIILEKAPGAVFLVKLPSTHNREFARALYSGVGFELDDSGEFKPTGSIIEATYAQQDAFVKGCIVSVNNEPVPTGFAEKYPEALAELMEKARALADELDAGIDEAVKKPPTISSGNKSGPGSGSSIEPSLKAAG